jgi:outer membrane protein OmpA-like peptidoglycan-associated protein
MIKVELSGHTDNVGDTQMNLDLSKSRAEVLKQYLVNKGISSERIFTQGYGSAFPRGDNTTEAGRRLNRRVEIKIL